MSWWTPGGGDPAPGSDIKVPNKDTVQAYSVPDGNPTFNEAHVGPDGTIGSGTPLSGGGLRSHAFRMSRVPYLKGSLAAIAQSTNYTFITGLTSPISMRVQMKSGPVGITNIRLYYNNWESKAAGELLPNSTLSVKAAIEYNGASYPVFFPGGVRNSVAMDNGGEVESLPVALDIPPNTTFYIRNMATFSGTTYTANGTNFFTTYFEGDAVDGTGGMSGGSAGTTFVFCPVAVTGVAIAPTIQAAVIGDSISQGPPTATVGGLAGFSGPIGYVRTALLNAGIPAMCVATYQEQSSQFIATHTYRAKFITGCDYATELYGVNDLTFNGAITLAGLQANRIAIWTLLGQHGCRVIAGTLNPSTTSTDSWTTVANQTNQYPTAAKPIRLAINQWIRAGAPIINGVAVPPGTPNAITCQSVTSAGLVLPGNNSLKHPLFATFDAVGLIESSQDSGLWAAPGGVAQTSDGVHNNAAGITTASAGVPVSLLI